MGRNGGTLIPWVRSFSAAVALGWLGMISAGGAAPVRADSPDPPAEAGSDPGLTPEDLALLREIDLLLEWELLREWDPMEDLPIPVEPPAEVSSPPGEDP